MTGCKSLFAITIAHMVSGLFSGYSSHMACLSADACKSGIRFSSECFAYLRSSIRGDWKRLRDDIDEAAESVTDLAASSDIEDIMLCDLEDVLVFLNLPADTPLPSGRKGKVRMKRLFRMVAVNHPYHEAEKVRPLIQALYMGKIAERAPLPLGRFESTLFGEG